MPHYYPLAVWPTTAAMNGSFEDAAVLAVPSDDEERVLFTRASHLSIFTPLPQESKFHPYNLCWERWQVKPPTFATAQTSGMPYCFWLVKKGTTAAVTKFARIHPRKLSTTASMLLILFPSCDHAWPLVTPGCVKEGMGSTHNRAMVHGHKQEEGYRMVRMTCSLC